MKMKLEHFDIGTNKYVAIPHNRVRMRLPNGEYFDIKPSDRHGGSLEVCVSGGGCRHTILTAPIGSNSIVVMASTHQPDITNFDKEWHATEKRIREANAKGPFRDMAKDKQK